MYIAASSANLVLPNNMVKVAKIDCPVGLKPSIEHIKDNQWELSYLNEQNEKVKVRNYYWDDEQTHFQNSRRISLIFHRMKDSKV